MEHAWIFLFSIMFFGAVSTYTVNELVIELTCFYGRLQTLA